VQNPGIIDNQNIIAPQLKPVKRRSGDRAAQCIKNAATTGRHAFVGEPK